MMFSDTPTVVHSRSPFDSVDQHAHHGAGAVRAVEHPDPEVLEPHVVELGVVVRERLAERGVERAHGPLAFGRLDVPRSLRAHLHGRLGERRLVVADALLDVHAVALDLEERLATNHRLDASTSRAKPRRRRTRSRATRAP